MHTNLPKWNKWSSNKINFEKTFTAAMDNVIRRQSEQLDNNYNDKNESDANYDYRKWEWGYLRVRL